jgi:hypothetical protein
MSVIGEFVASMTREFEEGSEYFDNAGETLKLKDVPLDGTDLASGA